MGAEAKCERTKPEGDQGEDSALAAHRRHDRNHRQVRADNWDGNLFFLAALAEAMLFGVSVRGCGDVDSGIFLVCCDLFVTEACFHANPLLGTSTYFPPDNVSSAPQRCTESVGFNYSYVGKKRSTVWLISTARFEHNS